MKKTATVILFATLCALAGASSATVHVECKTKDGKCVVPPAPPAPPAPPTPPAPPPLPPDGSTIVLPAVPAIAPLPAIPAPPPPPELPEIPAASHAACAGKAPGSEVTYTIKKGEYMRGYCEREDGKMVFVLRVYHLE